MRAAPLVLLLAGCADLPPMPAGVCGNGVIDEGESCDTISTAGDGTACAAAEVEHACRYVCAADDTVRCPDGWSCGDDRACRHASGTFAQASGSPWRFFADGFVIGDIDGDEVDDLVGHRASGLHVRFGSADGQFRTEFLRNTDIQVGVPAIADIDGDDRLDIVAAVTTGLTGFLGQGDRTLAPVVYGSWDLPSTSRFVMLRPASHPKELPLVITDAGMVFKDTTGAEVGPVTPLPTGGFVGSIVGEIPVDDRLFALTFTFGTEVHVYGAGKNEFGENFVELIQTLYLPAEVYHGVRFADVDGDGIDDLMISLNLTGPGGVGPCSGGVYDKVAVAYGLGGSFAAPVIVDAFDSVVDSCCSSRAWPVAMGNLDGDADASRRMADVVGESAVCLRDGAGGFVNVGGNPGGGFFESVIADFNRDGANDIAAADNSGVTFFLGNSTGYFTLHRQETFLTPTQLRIGDFDGDFVTDLAFVLVGGADQRVVVSYGQLQGGPDAPVTMARLANVVRVAPSDLGGDLPTDLVIHGAARSGDGAMPGGAEEPLELDPALAFLYGNSQRGMVSPLPLQGTLSADLPYAAFVGDFDQSGEGDILAVADPSADGIWGRRLWLLPGTEGGQFDRDDAMTWTFIDDALSHWCMIWHMTDLDGDGGAPDLVGFDGCAIDELGNQLSGTIVQARLTVAGTLDVATAKQELPDNDNSSPVRVNAEDADADGLDDLIVIYGQTRNFEDGLGAPAVAVFRNGGGTFDVAAPRMVTAYYAYGEQWWVAPLDAAPVNVDDDPVLELAILTLSGVFIADVVDGDGSYGDAQLAIEAQVNYGARLRASDVDGDGLGDLVFVSNGEAQVWRSVAAEF